MGLTCVWSRTILSEALRQVLCVENARRCSVLLRSVLAATANVPYLRPHGLTDFVDLDFSVC